MLKRRDLLKASAALPLASAGAQSSDSEAKKNKKKRRRKKKSGRDFSQMNVILFITDQQRAIMHFPEGWAEANLPGATRLEQNGLSFTRAYCNACMCSPSRATLFTGFFPAQHGVKYTLEEDMPSPQYPQVELPLNLPNLATVMKAAGFQVPYKGKFHLTKPQGADWEPNDVNKYGWERWNPPDAGANQDIDQFGGGDPNNDGRYMNDDGPYEVGDEGVFEFLNSPAAKQQKFFLTVSLVNPHDVLSSPNTYDAPGAGYDDRDLVGTIGLPETVDESLSTKPTAQQQFLVLSAAGIGPLNTDQKKRDYLNFYGNLMKESDAYLVQILNTLDKLGMRENTLIIQTSDHGEMGMAHGGLRQKNFNFYEETLTVALVYSNPMLYSKPMQSNAMVSHVDFLPTMASLFGAPDSAKARWQGVDYAKILRKPKKHKEVQKYVVFTYDDFQAGQASGPYVQPPNHITSIREGRYKLAKYYDVDGTVPEQWEMYDLQKDPLETVNIAYSGYSPSKNQRKELNKLQKKLANVEATRLQPL